MTQPDTIERGLRLTPIDRPRGLLLRLFSWWFKTRLGKVMMPLRVIMPRFPAMVLPHLLTVRLTQGKLDLDATLCHLVEVHASRLNGCTFCEDLHRAVAYGDVDARDKYARLHDLDDPAFSPAERAALRYVQQAREQGQVDDAVFAELRRHFDEGQVVQLTWLNAVVNYTNLLALPLGLVSEGFCELAARRAGVASGVVDGGSTAQ